MHPRLKAAQLLYHTLSGRSSPGVRVERCVTAQGTAYDLYQPASPSLRTVILVYGFDLPGEKDGRLVRFAQACARSGLRAAAPALPGLKSFQPDEGDLHALVDLAGSLHAQAQRPVGMIGFSVGGSYALLAAADPRVAPWIDPVLTFSSAYSLEDMLHTQAQQLAQPPHTQAEWDHFIWIQLILAYRSLDRLELPAAQRRELVDLLYRYCDEGLRSKQDFYQRVLRACALPGIEAFGAALPSLDPFCLRGRLGAVQSRVLLLHDPEDLLVPPEHSQRTYTELQGRGDAARQRLLVTRLVAHVSPRYGLRWRELLGILDLMGELFVNPVRHG